MLDMPLAPGEVCFLYTLGTPLRLISLFFFGFWDCRDCWTQSSVQQQQQQLVFNARLSPDDDIKVLDLFFCVRVMIAVCAHVLMSFLSVSLSVPCSYIINLFIHIVTYLRMLNHTSSMVCVTELFFFQVNMLLGKHCCKVFYAIQ